IMVFIWIENSLHSLILFFTNKISLSRLNYFLSKKTSDHLLSEIVFGWAKSARSDDEICFKISFFKASFKSLLIVGDGVDFCYLMAIFIGEVRERLCILVGYLSI